MIYRFGEFRLDSERETLADADGPVALRDHALRVLKLLLANAPEVVSKEQILEHVWGHDALSESSVPQVIKDIRQALRDSAKSPELIVTRYGRGYQFVGYVDVEEPGNGVPAVPLRRRRSLVQLAWLAALLLVVMVVAIVQLREPAAEPSAPALTRLQYPQPVLIRAVESDNGESLSRPYAEYLSFVLGSSASGVTVTVADDDRPVLGAKYLDVSLAISEDATRRYSLQLSAGDQTGSGLQSPSYYAKPEDLVGASLDRMLAVTGISAEFSVDAGIVSRSGFATEILLRGMAAQYAGESKRAIALFEACLAEDPSFDFARYELAIALRKIGDYAPAVAELTALESRHPSDFWQHRIHNSKGIAYWRMGQYADAEASLRLAQEHAPSAHSRAVVGVNVALLLRDQGQFVEAEQAAREAVTQADRERYPTTAASALNTLASILMRTGRLNEAKAPLDQARELFYAEGNRGAHASVLSRGADVHQRLGEYEQAEQLIRLVIGIREQLDDQLGLAASLLDLAQIERVRGNFSQSRELARRALGLAGAETYLLCKANIALGSLALVEQKYADALVYANEAQRLANGRQEPDLISQVEILRLRVAVRADKDGSKSASNRAVLDPLLTQAEALGEPNWIGQLILLRGDLGRLSADRQAALGDYAAARALAKLNTINDLQVEALLALARVSVTTDPATSAALLEAAAALNPPAYPYLILLAQVKSKLGQTDDALALAHQAKQQSGDWWQPEDEKLLSDLISEQNPQ